MATEPKPAPAQAAPRIDHVDRIDVNETYTDSIQSVVFDGQSLRINFGVTRLDDVRPGQPQTGKRYTACRLVLSPGAALDLINRMQQTSTALAQAGILRSTPQPAAAADPARKN